MKLLAIDTSLVSTASVGLWFSETEQIELTLNNPESQERKLFPLIDAGLSAIGHELSEIEGIVVGIGPGSFTGLRIGISAAQGLAFAKNLRLIGIPTLDAFEASLLPAREKETLIVPALDARMNRVFAAIYRNGKKLTPDLDIEPTILREKILSEKPRRVAIAGDALKKYSSVLCDLPGVEVSVFPEACPRGLAFCDAALALEKNNPSEILGPRALEPIYLRRSEAEEQLDRKKN